MRRADRLFRIVQRLRRRGATATTAAQLAQTLEVSERTVYRDVRDLLLSGVPIQGEPGVGYALERSFDLPPIMFDDEEIEALVLGARIVKAWADPKLARAADDALAKIDAVLPQRLKGKLRDAALFAPDFHAKNRIPNGLEELRRAIREQRKVRFHYVDRAQAGSDRTIHPLALAYWGQSWTLTGWCEMRQEFRSFRVDRVEQLAVLDERFETVPGQTLADFLALMDAEERAKAGAPVA